MGEQVIQGILAEIVAKYSPTIRKYNLGTIATFMQVFGRRKHNIFSCVFVAFNV